MYKNKDAYIGIIWGLSCAFSMFLNTVLPEPLYKKYSTDIVMSWGMLASVEVVAAALPASLWLNTSYAPSDLFGFGLIIATLFVINANKNTSLKLILHE